MNLRDVEEITTTQFKIDTMIFFNALQRRTRVSHRIFSRNRYFGELSFTELVEWTQMPPESGAKRKTVNYSTSVLHDSEMSRFFLFPS